MLLNNLLRPNLPLFFYSLFYISSMEGKGFQLSCHYYIQRIPIVKCKPASHTCWCHFVTFHLL